MSAADSRPICVVGAGVCGLFTARRLLELGSPVEVIERRADLGGLWNRDARYGGVYRSAHLISSKHSTELPDFPMPEEYPDYPNHRQVLNYLERFAARHDLRRHITFNRQVERARPLPGGGWEVELDDGTRREYAGLVVANGHHWDPAVPAVSDAEFDGTTLHSAEYDTPDIFADKKVVVVGLGNTACDIAVDAVYAGAEVTMSVRGGNQLIPKYLLGMPVDRLNKGNGGLLAKLPAAWRNKLQEKLIRKLSGSPERFGLPTPAHRLYERQPLVNSLLPYHLGHGDIRVKPPVTQLRNSTVVFADGSEEKADVVVWCTGYRVSLPFLDVRADLNGDEQGRPRLWLNMFHPERDDVVAVGLVDPFGSFNAFDTQAQLAARHLHAATAGGGSPLRPLISAVPPVSGDGPDRDWLFRDRSYVDTLKGHLVRFPSAGR